MSKGSQPTETVLGGTNVLVRDQEQGVAPFEAHAAGILGRLREAFEEIVHALPGPVERAHELEKTLKIDRTLAWKIMKLVGAKDGFRVAKHVPKPVALGVFLRAAARAEVPSALIDSVRSAASEFERLEQVHADDRSTLETMLGDCAGEGDPQSHLAHKRAAFRAIRHLWGLHATTHLVAALLQPSAEAGRVDLAWICGHVDLSWLRSGARWVLATSKMSDEDQQVRRPMVRDPIDGETAAGGVPLLKQFCSEPLPQFRRLDVAPGVVQDELIGTGLGNTAAVTYFTGEITRSVGSATRDEHNTHDEISANVNVPAEVLILDMFVRDDTFGAIDPELRVYRGTREARRFPFTEADELHLGESLAHLGKGLRRVNVRDVPRYVEMCAHVFDNLGWEAPRFDVYRCRVEYPVVPSSVTMRFERPERLPT